MNKSEIRKLVSSLNLSIDAKTTTSFNPAKHPLNGIGCSDFPLRKPVTFNAILEYLKWQCVQFNGEINQLELSDCLELLKKKKVICI
ncbi:MAG: hypothetical protein GY861_01145 [bacterium]|nr:hypothetical protein [bacterium]